MKNNILILKRLWKDYTSKYLKNILFAIIFSIILAGSTSSIAYLLDPAIEKVFIEKDKTMIYLIPIFIILAFTTKGISLYMARVIMIKVAENAKADVQKDMIKALLLADTKVMEKRHSGKYVTHLTLDVGLITNLISTTILNLFKDTLTLIGLLGVMFYQNWKLSMFALIMIPLATIAAKSLGKRITKVSHEIMEKAGFFTSYMIEIFKNHKLIKIFQNEKFEKSRAQNKIDAVREKSKKMAIVYVRASPIMEFLTGIMIAILIFYSGKLIANNEIDINNFFSFLAAMMLAYQPVRSLATLNIGVHQGIAAAKRVLPIIDLKKEQEIIDDAGLPDLKISNSDIDFKNVNFAYNKEEKLVLNAINLNLKGGRMTALVGHSGAGKSTIMNLIPRFYDCDNGDILIDKQSIYKINSYSLRKNISLVSQDINLFDDTIKNNVAYAKLDASDKDIEIACKNSFASEFIEKLSKKYQTVIGENGVRLSGGEKQRLSIARAMLKKSPIILLDEATSSLDAETESKIQNAINMLTKNKTTIVIAHRLSTIVKADNIFVVDGGKIIAEGNHEFLLSNSEVYKNFYEKQISNK